MTTKEWKIRTRIIDALTIVAVSVLLSPILLMGQAARPPVTTLNGLSDVTITSPTNGQTLIYNSGSSQWTNSAASPTSLAGLSDVAVVSPAGSQVLQWDAGSSRWVNYGPLAFSDVSGNITVAQMGGGVGATASSVWKGDGTWGAVPTAGIVPPTTNVLIGDGAGNALDATASGLNLGSTFLNLALSGNFATYLNVSNVDAIAGHTSTIAGISLTTGNSLNVEQLGPFFTTSGIFTANDGRITQSAGNLDIAVTGGGYVKFSPDGGTTEKIRMGNGLMVGTTTDPGTSVINLGLGGGIRVNNTAPYGHVLTANGTSFGDGVMPGKNTVTSTVDQTATADTAHISFTVPANACTVGTMFRIHASGNIDNGTTSITMTPKVKWSAGVGAVLVATPAFATSTTGNTNRAYEYDATVTIRTTGSSGTAVGECKYIERSSSAGGTEVIHMDNSGATAVGGVDTTVSSVLSFNWAMNVSTGTPHIRTISASIEIVKP